MVITFYLDSSQSSLAISDIFSTGTLATSQRTPISETYLLTQYMAHPTKAKPHKLVIINTSDEETIAPTAAYNLFPRIKFIVSAPFN